MKIVNDDSFKETVIDTGKIVLAEFYSDGCVPCKMMSPLLANLEEEYENIDFVKVNVAFAEETVKRYGVMSSPTILLFKNGIEVKRLKGVQSEDCLTDALEEVLL